MNIVFASDIHGSATWCGKLMDRIEQLAPDRVVLLGDLLYHGPRNPLPDGYNPQEVARMLNNIASRIVAVRGNCEAEVDQMMLEFPCMADYALVADGDLRVFCTHGHLWSPDSLPPLMPGDVFASGHTHVKVLQSVKLEGASGAGDEIRLLNPGSVSLPKDGSHSFATYLNGEFALHTLE